MEESKIRSYAPLGKAIAPKASRIQVAWYVFWAVCFVAFLFIQLTPFDVVFAAASVGMMVFGTISTNERPLFMAIPHYLYLKWRFFRHGVAVTRQLSSTDLTYRKGVTPLQGVFNINATNVSLVLNNGTTQVIPVFRSGGRHTVMIVGKNSGDTEVATPRDRQAIDQRRADMFGRASKTLGPGNSMAQWSITRPPDPNPGMRYIALRGDEEAFESDDEKVVANINRAYESNAAITQQSMVRLTGVTLNATDPRSWKPRRLHKMSSDQVRESLAIKAALEMEASALRAKIIGAHIALPLEFARMAREIWSLGPELNDVRRHALQDRTESIKAQRQMEAEAKLAAEEGRQPKPIPTPDLWLDKIEPMPQFSREVAGDYFILDGTYHRVMWVIDSSLHEVQGGFYDPLHQMDCNNIVSISGMIVSRKEDEKTRNRRGDARDYFASRRRYAALEETQAMEAEEQGKVAVFYSGGNAIYFRILIVASGRSFEELQESEEVIRSTASDLNLELVTITGADQLIWYWAAVSVIAK